MPSKHLQSDAAAWPWLRAALAAGLQGVTVPPIPPTQRGEVMAAVARHRLQGLLYRWGVEEPIWRLDYLAAVARAERWLREAHCLAETLEARGIPCLVLRGPLAALRWHGDPAARAFADLDVLVPEQARRSAYAAFGELGYTDQTPALSLRYYDAVHYHYALRQQTGDVRCDLHWAVDHPFRREQIPYVRVFAESTRIDVDGKMWRVANPDFELLLTCLHVAKEWRQSAVDPQDDPLLVAWWTGQLARWVDLVRMQEVLADRCRPERVLQLAREIGAGPDVERVLFATSRLRDATGPVVSAATRPRLVEEAVWYRWWRQWRGCRRFVAPPAGLSPTAQVAHCFRSLHQLGTAGSTAMICLMAARLRTVWRMA